jgi:hypothetical protein
MRRVRKPQAWLFVVSGLLSVCLIGPAGAPAFAAPTCAAEYLQQTNLHTARFVSKARTMQATASSSWSAKDQDVYLSNALAAVKGAVFSYMLVYGEMPKPVDTVVDAGLLAVWPANPYDGWKPMQVNANGLAFSAGNLTLQLPPKNKYSFGPDGRTRLPLSFQMGVFGGSQQRSTGGRAKLARQNASWATVPEMTLYMLGSWFEAADSVLLRTNDPEEIWLITQWAVEVIDDEGVIAYEGEYDEDPYLDEATDDELAMEGEGMDEEGMDEDEGLGDEGMDEDEMGDEGMEDEDLGDDGDEEGLGDDGGDDEEMGDEGDDDEGGDDEGDDDGGGEE